MERKILIAPSLLSADFGRLAEEVRAVEKAGCDWIHMDVMDGFFVPNITIGPLVVKSIRKATNLTLDVHLMIERPEKFIKDFAEAGSDVITFHAESCKSPKNTIELIRSFGKRVGVSVKPKTNLGEMDDLLGLVDMVLIMTVEPGFGGQAFMNDVLPKIKKLRSYYDGDIEVDGGINAETAVLVIDAGANILVAGNAIFCQKDYKKAINDLRRV